MDEPKDDPLTILFDSVGRNGGDQMKTNLRLFASDLLHGFNRNQTVSILKGYVNSGKLETLTTIEIVMEARKLNDLWNRKVWTENMAENFQISILTQPEWEGVSYAFMNHPAYRHLVGSHDHSRLGRSPGSTNMREQWEEGNKFTLYRDDSQSVNNNNNNSTSNRTKIVFTEEETPLIRDPYDLHEELVEDCEEIEMLVAHSKRGVTYVYGAKLIEGTREPLGFKFDLLRAFRSDTDCVIRMEFGSFEQEKSSKWCKDMDVCQNIWYNFAEDLLPINSGELNLKVSFLGAEEESINLKIMGVYMTESEREQQELNLQKNGFDPYLFGFRRQFKLKV
ncbi:MAG: hypothetical protein WCI55_12200 [Armatimonadota bacterium]